MNGELSVWRNMVWGRQLLQVHGLQDGWSYGHNYLDEQHCSLHQPQTASGSGRFVREAGTSIVLGKNARRVLAVFARHRGGQAEDCAGGADGFDVNEYPYQALSQSYPLYLRRSCGGADARSPLLDFRHVPEGAILAATRTSRGFA